MDLTQYYTTVIGIESPRGIFYGLMHSFTDIHSAIQAGENKSETKISETGFVAF